MKAVYIPRNRMEETGNALLKTAPVEVDMVVRVLLYPDSIWQFSLRVVMGFTYYSSESICAKIDDYHESEYNK